MNTTAGKHRNLPRPLQSSDILPTLHTAGAHPYTRNHACVNDGDSPDLITLESTTQPTILQGFPLVAHRHLHLPTQLFWLERWEGSLFRSEPYEGGGIFETPTEACSHRFSTTRLRKASELSRFSLFSVG